MLIIFIENSIKHYNYNRIIIIKITRIELPIKYQFPFIRKVCTAVLWVERTVIFELKYWHKTRSRYKLC